MPVDSHLMFTHKQNLEDDRLTLTIVSTQSYQAKCSRQIANSILTEDTKISDNIPMVSGKIWCEGPHRKSFKLVDSG